MPTLRGLDEDAAQDALRDKQLEFGESTGRYSENVPAGTVHASRPAAGTELDSGDTVDLVRSRSAAGSARRTTTRGRRWRSAA